MPYTGQVYLFYTDKELPIGAYVRINQPEDTFGTVIAVQKRALGWLTTVRGIKKRHNKRTKHTF